MVSLRQITVWTSVAVGSTVFAMAPVLVNAQASVAAGAYETKSTQAAFSFFAPDFSSGINVDVETHASTSTPKVGSPSTSQTMTASVEVFQSGGIGFTGCYNLAPGEFSLGTGLAGASLHMTVTSATPTCGQAEIPTPFNVDVTWIRSGPIRASRLLTHSDCLDYRTAATRSETYTGANVTATVAPLIADPVTANDSGVLRTLDEVNHVQGTVHDSCPEQPGAVAGGAGPPNPGEYRNSSSDANVTKFNDTGSFTVDLSDTTVVSSPRGGPSTTTHQMQVQFSVFSNGNFGSACFVLSTSDFSFNGVQTAEVNATFTVASPTCFGETANIPLPQSLHVVWTDTTPMSNFRTDGRFDCLTYHDSGQSTVSTDHPNVTATLTPFLADGVTDSGLDTSLTVRSGVAHAAGIKQLACHI
jgi:hypothetical protein